MTQLKTYFVDAINGGSGWTIGPDDIILATAEYVAGSGNFVPMQIHGTRTGTLSMGGEKPPTNEDLMNLTQGVIDRIEKIGWIQGHYTNESGSCLMGHAIAITNIEKSYAYLEFSPRRAIVDGWEEDFGKFTGCINVVQFNDDLKTTKEIVLEKLRDYMYELKGR